MCAFIPIMAGVAVAVSAAGTYAQVKGAQGNAKAQQTQAATNMRVAYEAARESEKQGERDVAKLRGEGAQLEARQKVAFAGSGIDLTSGTVQDTAEATSRFLEQDVETTRRNAALTARGYRTQGLQYGQVAANAKTAGAQAVTGTILGGVGGALGTIAQAYGQTKAQARFA